MTKPIPEGFHSVSWMIATHIKDLTTQEIQQGARAFFTRTAKK